MTEVVRFAPRALTADERLQVDDGEIHIWSLPLDPPAAVVAACRQLLSADERQRADRFRFDRHRRRFIVGRGALRDLLRRYTGHPADALQFTYGEKGKPSLAAAHQGPSFNLSNSHEHALVAVTPAQALGVDVEHLRPMDDADQIAERFFSRPERDSLLQISEHDKSNAFFRCWTRKEAYIKAVGDGLSMALDRFDVTLESEEDCRFLALDGDPDRARAWTLRHLDPPGNYVGALALEGGPWTIHAWRLQPTARPTR